MTADLSIERTRWLAKWLIPLEPGLRVWVSRRCAMVAGIDVDDVVQELYLIMHQLESVEHIRSPHNYLFQTAHSIILRHLRRQRIVKIDYHEDLDILGAVDDRPSPETEVIDRLELLRLEDLLAAIPAKQQEAFRLLKLEGLSQRAAAQRMGISESTIEKHVAKALFYLMHHLERGGKRLRRASVPAQALHMVHGVATEFEE